MLSKALSYNPKPSAISSKSTRVAVPPNNGATFLGQNSAMIRIAIPTGVKGSYLNPGLTYLKFAVTADAPLVTIDRSVYSVFQRLVIQHNGVILESVEQYGLLANMLLDMGASTTQLDTDLNQMIGTQASGNMAMTQNTKIWFAMPILSSFFSMQDKYLPLGELTGDLNLELTLDPYAFLINTGTYGYTVSDCELMYEEVTLDHAVTSAIRSETLSRDGAFKIPLVSWRNVNTTVPVSSTTANALVPIKVNSMKNILVAQRAQGNVTSHVLSKADRNGGSDFSSVWWSFGSAMVPSKPISTVAESYCELQKSMHNLSLSGVNNLSTLSRTAYGGLRFISGIETESMGAHDSDLINCGLNTTQMNIFFNPIWSTGLGVPRRLDFFAQHDGLCLIDANGQASVVF